MALDVDSLEKTMIAAARGKLLKQWTTVEPLVTTQLSSVAQRIADIQTKLAEKQISAADATDLVAMQKGSAQAVIAAAEGIGLVAAQNAINAALGAVAGAVNKALGIALL